MKKSNIILSLSFILLSSVSLGQASQKNSQIAGLHPDKRPVNAPIIKKFIKGDQWYQNALHGISSPYPASLQFLEDQGAWHTPFIKPGFKGAYDIRNWHKIE